MVPPESPESFDLCTFSMNAVDYALYALNAVLFVMMIVVGPIAITLAVFTVVDLVNHVKSRRERRK